MLKHGWKWLLAVVALATIALTALAQGTATSDARAVHASASLAPDQPNLWLSTPRTALPDALQPLDNIAQVAAGYYHTCALTTAGGVKCWGHNYYGELGDGTKANKSTPVDVVGLDSGVSAITAGYSHTCALTTAGGVKCWGGNGNGQLGDGTTTNSSTPVAVVGLGSGVSAVTAGGSHTCALTTAGGVKCWGWNGDGELGDGTTADSSTPVAVVGLGSGVSTVTAGGAHTCALTTAGGVKCWGGNWYSQLGDGMTSDRSTPVDVVGLGSGVSAVTAGGYHTCAVTTAGGVKCWGRNGDGRLGDGTTANKSTPVDVLGLGSGVSTITAGNAHTCALITAGDVRCWGANYDGQLGDGTTEDSSTPVAVVGLGSGVSVVMAGGDHTCALTTVGGVKCWGRNGDGELGDGTTADSSTPVAVVGLGSGVSTITAGGSHTCALTTAGGVKCWGRNDDGQLGDGTTTPSNTPVAVVGLNSGGSAITAGGYHTCALTTNGGVRCWGANWIGQLGDGSTASSSTPVAVVGLGSGMNAISAGDRHTCALTTVGGAKCWGANYDGRLGDGTTASSSTPVGVVGLASGVSAITAGWYHTCAVTASGGANCWGWNSSGQLGDGNAWRTTPVDVLREATSTPTATFTPSPTPTGTSTPTPTNTPSPTPTNTPTPTPTNTPTPTSTPTVTSASPADAYEPDDDCPSARTISADGVSQRHTLQRQGDEDWVRFDAAAGAIYQIDAMPLPDSPADLMLEFYIDCVGLPDASQGYSFSNGVRIDDYTPAADGPVYLRLLNHDPAVAGAHVAYRLSVRRLDQDAGPGALILVAGRKRSNDPAQPKITYVARTVYNLFRDRDYPDDRILYLTTDLGQPGADALPSVSALRTAITTWARDKVDAQRPLTVFLVDHGDRDVLYLDGSQRLTPADLDAWLTALENDVPDLKVNVIVEACKSGSFIVGSDEVSKPGRVIVTATTDDADAYTSNLGAHFSDHFLAELGRNSSLASSFIIARQAAVQAHPRQNAWLDGDGDGIPNEPADEAVAAQRGFGIPGTLGEAWPPYIAAASPPAQVTGGRGVLRATVLDDTRVRRVWAVIYPPDYTPPPSSDELVTEVMPTIVLQPGADNVYAAEYTGFDQQGAYRVVIYAEDEDGLPAQPVPVIVNSGSRALLPLIVR
ncbi:MAG: hypothetical protein IAE85_07655 [Anaerolinea sp.]|nr:hypothetical protein [Anaerolinea sp.]